MGNVYTCDKRKRLTGDCPAYDYDFIELEAMDIDKWWILFQKLFCISLYIL